MLPYWPDQVLVTQPPSNAIRLLMSWRLCKFFISKLPVVDRGPVCDLVKFLPMCATEDRQENLLQWNLFLVTGSDLQRWSATRSSGH